MTIFICKDGRTVDIEYSDELVTVWSTSEPREKVGSFSFSYIEGDYPHGQDIFLVTNMHLEGAGGTYGGQGIGREIIKTVGSGFLPVVFRRPDGNKYEDGSHLTGNGSGFAAKMVKDGLACWDGVDDLG